MTVLQPQTRIRRKTSINRLTSMFQLFGVYITLYYTILYCIILYLPDSNFSKSTVLGRLSIRSLTALLKRAAQGHAKLREDRILAPLWGISGCWKSSWLIPQSRSSQFLRLLAPKSIPGMVLGARNTEHWEIWVLGPPGYSEPFCQKS